MVPARNADVSVTAHALTVNWPDTADLEPLTPLRTLTRTL